MKTNTNSQAPQPKFIQPFSRGQITLPKKYREYLDIKGDSWLRISLQENRILLEPVEERQGVTKIKPARNAQSYKKALLKINGGWIDQKDSEKIKEEVTIKLSGNEKNFD